MTNDPNSRETEKRARSQGQIEGGEPMRPLKPDHHTSAHPAVETPVEGRQGFLGRPVLLVLIGGLIFAGFAWIAVHFAVN